MPLPHKKASKLFQKAARAHGFIRRGASAAKQSRLGHRIMTIGSAVVGGVIGGGANGLAGDRRLATAKASTVLGAAGALVSLAVKGPTGDAICTASAGSLALSAGEATEQMVKSAKIDGFLKQLELDNPKPGKAKGALGSGSEQPQLAGENSTALTEGELKDHAVGAASRASGRIPVRKRGA